MTAVSVACNMASVLHSTGTILARQRAGKIVAAENTTTKITTSISQCGYERADGRGDGAGQLVVAEEPTTVEARGEDHARRGRQLRWSQSHITLRRTAQRQQERNKGAALTT